MQLSDVDYRDIQGLVRFAYSHLKEAHFHLLRITDVGAARSWLAAAPVTTAVKHKPPDTALQVAFTYEGLMELGGSPDILKQFPYEFISGMAEESRSRRLGDVDANHPKNWLWGGPGKVPHVLVLVYATTHDRLACWEKTVKGSFWDSAFSEPTCLSTDDDKAIEPFGFADGTSQPELDWERQKSARVHNTTEYTNLSALGEFLLGYPNEYGKYTDRPLIDPGDDPENLLHLAEDTPGKKDFGRNGSYLVLRDLSQDVPRFWQFVDRQANHKPQDRRKLGGTMVGRMPPDIPIIPSGYNIVPADDPKWLIPPGASITPLGGDSIPGVGPKLKDIWLNQFTYRNDPDGTTCPYGAHIRRANPRNADLPEGTRGWIARLIRILGFGSKHSRDDLLASTRFHRILRRGREYGPLLKPEDAAKEGAQVADRGLRFICLNANISRQFEFIQASWITNPKFDGLDEGDPLLGNRVPLGAGGITNTFSIPQASGRRRRIDCLTQFVTVRGGGYFFMPGISALRHLASGPHSAVS